MCNLPIELIGEIVQYTDFETCKILKNYIPSKIFELMRKNILIYGNVQSGKTNIILNILKDKDFTNQRKVVVIQNSLLVLKQYEERMKKKNIFCLFMNVGLSSGVSRIIITKTNPEFKPYTGDILYVENITKTQREDGQAENIKIVVRF